MIDESSFSVTELVSASKEIDGLYESYDSRLKQIESNMAGVFNQSWKGAAQKAFSVEWEDWHSRALSIARLLGRMSSDLDSFTHDAVPTVDNITGTVQSGFSDIVQW